MNLLITICVRGGSKGIPGKNIRKLNGIPLIAYTIFVAQRFAQKYGADISLSTDSLEIVNTASDFRLITNYVRPQELATDDAGKIPTIKHLLLYEEQSRNKKYEYILDLDVTSPLRSIQDLEESFDMIKSNDSALNIFSVSPPNRNPYFNMVEPKADGFCKLVKDDFVIKSRQAAPIVYDMNASFYFYRRRFFDQDWQTAITDKSMFYLIPHICFDLDHSIDFTIMETLVKGKLLDFEFLDK